MEPGYEVRADLQASRDAAWRHLAAPGTWWSGEERLAIAREARAARRCGLCAERRQAVSPAAVTGAHERGGDLPEAVADVIHRVVTDPGRLSKSWLQGVLAGPLDDAQYVELVSVAVVTHALDLFERALSREPQPLPAPTPGAPSRERPALARDDGAWVPLVPDGAEGGEAALAIYQGMSQVPNIGRALSLVPAEVAILHAISGPHYMPLARVGDPSWEEPGRALDRPQTELVAARVSRMNECFY